MFVCDWRCRVVPSRLATPVNSSASQIFIHWDAGSAVAGAGRTIRKFEHWYLTAGTTGYRLAIATGSPGNATRRNYPGDNTAARKIFTIRRTVDYPARD